jgi:hypothetical protein
MSAKQIKVKIITIGGEEHEIETPVDIKTADFIEELIVALKLTKTDAEGHPVNWRLDDKDIGRTLDPNQTLEAGGVQEGHRLNLIRAVVAG